jgi:hypothetical protein
MGDNYAPSTRARIADMNAGMRVETNILAAASYWLTGNTNTQLFNVIGRIKVMQLFSEVITDLGAQACDCFYTYTSTTPTITVQPISATNAGDMGSTLRGGRHICVGTTVATACLIDAQEGISPAIMKEKMIIGLKGGVGTIGMDTATASLLSGTIRVVMFYVPASDGAYATNIL